MIEHTPGPWKYDEAGAMVLTEDDRMTIADIRGFGSLHVEIGTSDAIKTMDANGRLIAEAPNMLAVLRLFAEIKKMNTWTHHAEDICQATARAYQEAERIAEKFSASGKT